VAGRLEPISKCKVLPEIGRVSDKNTADALSYACQTMSQITFSLNWKMICAAVLWDKNIVIITRQ